ncbi:MAG: carboxypeptidase-like regulatory domain-containing protein [Mucilaginibacter sp.]|nr:carboxypeptidase-like regulatory domain-containing protein [Mucilaginibacter sp.]
MKQLLLTLFAIITTVVTTIAQQQDILIDVDYNQANISQITLDLTSKTGFRFFYDPAQMDSLQITFNAQKLPLKAVLARIFDKTKYYFFVTDDREVILTKNVRIIPGVVGDDDQKYNDITGKQAESVVTNAVNPKPVVNATSENKLYVIGSPNSPAKGNVTLTGYVSDANTGETILGATVSEPESRTRTATNQFGFFTIILSPGRHVFNITALSMKDIHRQVAIYADGRLNIEMQQQITALKEVKISAEKVANVRSLEMGVSRIDAKSIKQVPTVFGEADVLRVVLTLPGVQTVGESSTGFNVRGGGVDQNLILLNGATIYNPSHFFGFFSSFDPDIVQDIQLYKSSIPEKFGGRLSSVLDITEHEGNNKKITGSAGIGLITSRLNIEGPLGDGKTTFVFGGRTSYANWLLKALPAAYKNSSASFYDLNLNLTHHINDKNTLYLTTYFSNDGFKLNSDTTYRYGNSNGIIKWKHNFNNKLFSILSGGYDAYKYSISSKVNPVNAYDFKFNISQFNIKDDFTYYLTPKHTLSFGISSIYYKIDPGTNTPQGLLSEVVPVTVSTERALESAVYLGDKYDITDALSFSLGVRFSIYNYLGPQLIRNYKPGAERILGNVTDSVYHKSGIINSYMGPEVRASVRYAIDDEFSIKASFNTLRQYINLLSNTTAVSPTDIWKLSDPDIKPQTGKQVSLGLYKNFASNTVETSVEAYYKHLNNYLDYRSGATSALNTHIATDVVETQGKAYGIEFFVKKATGRLNGWLTYTYSRTFLRQDDPGAGMPINGGAYYPANYDKPHAVNLVGNYRFTHRYSFSLNAIYSTGRPITYPIAEYYYGGSVRVLYSDRNQYRIPDYFRIDFSVNLDGNHKVHQRFHNSWTFGVYNITGRDNAYSTYFSQQGGGIQGYKLSIFSHPIPFINYNIRF